MKDALAIKQCEANILAVFRHYGLPTPKTVATLVDRTIFEETTDFLVALLALVPAKFEGWPFNRNHGCTAVRGWRERIACYSVQIVEHDYGVLECDVDEFNPGFGVAPATVHLFAEVVRYYIFRRKTDPFRVLKGLRKRGINVTDVREKEIST